MNMQDVKTIGKNLIRPEGVMALDDGSLVAADGRGCCARIASDGQVSYWGYVGGVPNGICIDPAENCIIANIGNGQVQSLAPDGRHTIVMTEANGRRMYAPNFPILDSQDRLWVSNSTARSNLEESLLSPIPDGCIVCIAAEAPPVIVAEGICFANGLALDESEAFLYVAETLMRRILRFPIHPDGSLGQREVYGPDILHPIGYPDGIAFDEAGNLWVTFPRWNAVGFVSPQGELKLVLEDPERKILKRPSNICFGGKDRRTAFIGSLEGQNIPFFRAPYPGIRLIHQTR